MKIKLLLICLLTGISAPYFFPQEQQISAPNQLWTNPDTQDFKEIQRRVEEYYLNRDKGRGSGYKQWKSWEYMMERRLTPDGKITNYTARNWEAWQKYQKEHIGNSSDESVASWSFLGPADWISGSTPGLGRINCIAFHPTDPDIIYVGAPSGGVWKTTAGGSSWTPITDNLPNIGVSGIVVDYVDPSILYILTGDGDGKATWSIGVLKSTNGGTTWENIGLSYPEHSMWGYKLAQHPTNNQILFFVQFDGLWKTTDGGENCNLVFTHWPGFTDLEFKPGNPDIMYLVSNEEFFRSTDTGDSWTMVTSGLTTGEQRIAIGVSPAIPEDVYLLCGSSTGAGSFKGLFRSTDSGLNFSSMTTTPNILGYNINGSDNGGQAWYDLAIAVARYQTIEITESLRGVSFINANVGTVVGVGGTILRTTNGGTTWTQQTSGITRNFGSICFTDENIGTAVGSNGTILRTTNGGTTWVSQSSGVTNYLGDVSFTDANNGTAVGGCNGCNGIILRTTDGGQNWFSQTSGTPNWLNGVSFTDANNGTVVGDNGTILRTTDGGTTWTLQSSGTTNLLIGVSFTDANVGTAVGYNGTILRTTNGGTDWISQSSGTTNDLWGVSFTDANNGTVVGQGGTILRTTNGGTTWTQQTSGTINDLKRVSFIDENNGTSVGWSGTILRTTDGGTNWTIHIPTSALITGGINTWRSTDYGSSFDITSYWVNPANSIGYTHPDIHALEINPLDDVLYCGSDGGLFRSTDFGDTWEDLSAGLGISQFYRIAGVDSNPDLIIGGTQDNGSFKYNGSAVFTTIGGGDGMDCMIDYTNTDIIYFSSQFGALRKSLNGGNTSTNIKPSGANGGWVTPFVMDPTNSSIIYGGYQDIYRSTNGGATWEIVGVGRIAGEALAIGTASHRLYASDQNRHLWTSVEVGIWSDITNYPLASHYRVTSIAVNPENSMDVYITTGDFVAGHKVFRSTDAGLTWQNYSGTLPNVIVNCIAYEDHLGDENDVLYIGTDVGVFYRNAISGDWVPFDQNLPNVIVLDLEINETNNVITAGTYGRGLWRSVTATELYLNVMIFLEGCFDSGVMNTGLKTLDLIPLTQPYNVSPWNYTGSETVADIPADVVDWVLIELRSNETTIVDRRAAFIKNDGSIVDLDGSSYIKFQTVVPDDYYVVIIHRNHLPIMTADKITLSGSPVLYDMRTDINKAYGTDAMVDLGGGVYGMYSGDANKDGQIDADDRAATWNERNGVGYKDEDVTMDGQVDADDRATTWNNRNVVSQVPTGTTAFPVKKEIIEKKKD